MVLGSTFDFLFQKKMIRFPFTHPIVRFGFNMMSLGWGKKGREGGNISIGKRQREIAKCLN